MAATNSQNRDAFRQTPRARMLGVSAIGHRPREIEV
jgi:hypothetical protein